MYNEVASGYGVSMATGFVLLNIDITKGTPSTALGPKMGMMATSLSRILKEMEEKGLIERKPNPNDGRGVLIFLTEFGIEKRKDAKAAVINFNRALGQKIDPTKAAVFFEVIEDIHQFISQPKEEVES